MKPTSNNLIVKPITKEEATESGIVITLEQNVDDFIKYGIVDSLGSAVNDDIVSGNPIKEGDRIAYFGNEAVDIEADGVMYQILHKDVVVLLD